MKRRDFVRAALSLSLAPLLTSGLEASPSRFLWTYPTKAALFSTPCVGAEGTIYLAGQDGQLTALASGPNPLWTAALPGGAWGSPRLSPSGHLVYAPTLDGGLYGFETRTGRVRWSRQLGPRLESTPEVAPNGVVFVGTALGAMVALNGETGSTLWKAALGNSQSSADASPTAAGDRLLLGTTGGELLALSQADGGVLWRFDARGPVRGAPVVVGQALYVACEEGWLYRLDAQTGREEWRYHAGRGVRSSPAVDGLVYLGSADGRIHAVNPHSGKLRWVYATRGAIYGSPLRLAATVYAGSHDGHLYAVEAETGWLRWRHPLGGYLLGSPVVADGILLAGSYDGKLYALRA